MYVWAATQYLYHDNKDKLKTEFIMDTMVEECFDTK